MSRATSCSMKTVQRSEARGGRPQRMRRRVSSVGIGRALAADGRVVAIVNRTKGWYERTA